VRNGLLSWLGIKLQCYEVLVRRRLHVAGKSLQGVEDGTNCVAVAVVVELFAMHILTIVNKQ